MTRAILLSLLIGCADKAPCEDCHSGSGETDSPGPDTQETAETADSQETAETADSQETAETADSQETGETGETGEPWDPNKPLELCINELMPDNDSALADEFGTYSDWIELHNPGEEDIELAGWTVTNDPDDHEMEELDPGLKLPAGGFMVFYLDSQPDLGAMHLDMKLSKDGGTIGVFAPDGRGSLITYGTVESDISAARVTDCCSGEGCWEFVYGGTPGTTNDPPEPEELELVAKGSTWRYWDLGSEPEGDWTALDYDDATWLEGAGPLGYGDSHIVTTVSYGADASAKYTTTYFRMTFSASDVDLYTGVMGGLLADDGAVVYLNGTEVERSSNLSAGELSYDTLTSGSTSDETGYGAFVVEPSLLLEGENVLAAEVHQSSLDSSDLGFDLELSAEYMPTE